MKTEEEREAEIALDVRKAKRERVEAEHSALMALRQELAKEERTKRKVRKEKLADFYYKIASLLLAGTVIASITPFIKDANALISWQPALFGLFAAILFAFMANYILKYNE